MLPIEARAEQGGSSGTWPGGPGSAPGLVEAEVSGLAGREVLPGSRKLRYLAWPTGKCSRADPARDTTETLPGSGGSGV